MYRLKKENIAKDGELMARNDELLRSVDALSVKNREIQQMLVNKIRETDNWNRDNEGRMTAFCVLQLIRRLYRQME